MIVAQTLMPIIWMHDTGLRPMGNFPSRSTKVGYSIPPSHADKSRLSRCSWEVSGLMYTQEAIWVPRRCTEQLEMETSRWRDCLWSNSGQTLTPGTTEVKHRYTKHIR